MSQLFDFTNCIYLVTGASSGIGKETAISLSKSGARVALVGRDNEALKLTNEKMVGEGHLIIPFDLTSTDDYSELFDYVLKKAGKLNGIVHCAGIAPVIPVSRLTRKRVEECMTINLYSFLELIRCIAKKKYRADNTSIVEISSINSIYPDKCQTIYVASKAAANAAVQALAIELYKSNIRVNSILPGIVNTPMAKKAFEEMGEENASAKQKKQVLGMTEPQEIVNVIQFLLSDSSLAITGRTIFADGGYINL